MTAPNAEMASVVIRKIRSAAADKGFDLDVKAEGVTGEDELVVLLLMVVEKITGVSTDSYVQLVEACRRIAAREATMDLAIQAVAADLRPDADRGEPEWDACGAALSANCFNGVSGCRVHP